MKKFLKSYCCGCSKKFETKESRHRSLIDGATGDMQLCDRCIQYEDKLAKKTNQQPTLLDSYKSRHNRLERTLQAERKNKQREVLLEKIDNFWSSILAGEMEFEIPLNALLSETDNGKYIQIKCNDNTPGISIASAWTPGCRAWLKVFVPKTTQLGDTIRIKRPSNSGRSYIAVITRYGKVITNDQHCC